jgi:hypothetical protein
LRERLLIGVTFEFSSFFFIFFRFFPNSHPEIISPQLLSVLKDAHTLKSSTTSPRHEKSQFFGEILDLGQKSG